MASTPTVAPTAPALGRFDVAKNYFMVGPAWDFVLIIGSPLLAFVLGVLASFEMSPSSSFLADVGPSAIAKKTIVIFTASHLFIVFFRSHGDKEIFRQFPMRFTVVPIALFAAVTASTWIMVCVAVLGVWWDVYHSALQTFGIGRIYDMKRGNGAAVGRRLDWWLNILIYIGPILAGVTLFDHLDASLASSEQFGSIFFTSIPAYAETYQRYMTWSILGIGLAFLVFYVVSYVRLSQRGYQISGQKIALLVSTALVSIWSWGFNTFGEAFFIMNFFHALQYFAIVWWSEKKNMCRTFGYESRPNGMRDTLVIFLAIGLAYGLLVLLNRIWGIAVLANIFLVVSIMHFWYDGFIWSVRKKQVPT